MLAFEIRRQRFARLHHQFEVISESEQSVERITVELLSAQHMLACGLNKIEVFGCGRYDRRHASERGVG